MNLVTHHTATPPTVTNALLPRLTLLVSPKDHHGKTFLALYLASIFPGIVFVEADSGAPTLRQALVGDRTCEPVDLEHKSAPAQLDGWLAHVGGGAVMVDNASRATPARLNEIIGQVHARTTLLCVMEENRPGTEAYVRELRQAVGGNADWLLVRNQRREPQRFIQDTEDWTESPVRLNYQRAGGREVYLPVAHPRLFAATNRLPRPSILGPAPQWGYYRERAGHFRRRLRRSLEPHFSILLADALSHREIAEH